MALGAALGRYPDELRADLQREYGLNIDRMGAEFSCAHAAACMAHMAGPSSLRQAVDESESKRKSDPMCGMDPARLGRIAESLGVRR